MTTLPTPTAPLALLARRLCVCVSFAGLLLLTASVWNMAAAGNMGELGGWAWLLLLSLLLACAPAAVLMRRFGPLPDMAARVDERQAQRLAEAYKIAFTLAWAVASALAFAYWVATLRGWSGLPAHPLSLCLPLAWLGFAGFLPSFVYAWRELDVE